jgi:hypothetical protein
MPGWRVEHLDGAFAKIRPGEFGWASDTVAALTERPASQHRALRQRPRRGVYGGRAAA